MNDMNTNFVYIVILYYYSLDCNVSHLKWMNTSLFYCRAAQNMLVNYFTVVNIYKICSEILKVTSVHQINRKVLAFVGLKLHTK